VQITHTSGRTRDPGWAFDGANYQGEESDEGRVLWVLFMGEVLYYRR